MASLPRPDVPGGPLRALFEALHELHHRAGWPSLRDMAREVGCSHTTVSVVFSGPRVPRWGVLELIVEALGGDTEEFHRLWLAASGASGRPPAEAAEAKVAPLQPPRELPADVVAFTGRAEELAALDGLLARTQTVPAMVVSVLSGTAGVGKTSLAVHWAHRVADRFPDGQLYLNLRGHDPDQPIRPADALAVFLRALDVPDRAIPHELPERAARYRTLMAGRRALVVLDNAVSVDQVRDLLPGTSSCFVVVTCRDTMPALVARYGAVRIDLDLLSLEEALALLRKLVGSRVDGAPDRAAELARRCARLPLALRIAAELAVARPGGTLAELVEELGEESRRLDLLAAGGDPYTAVRTVFSWSLRHLSTEAADAFKLLGLHPGADLHRRAAAALIGTDAAGVRGLLDALTRAHLITGVGTDRVAMHDLLRAFAAEQARTLSQEPRRTAMTRLLDHYLAAATEAMRVAFPASHPAEGPPQPAPAVETPATAIAWLDAERANLVAVARLAAKGSAGHAIRLSTTLAAYLDARAHYHDALVLHGLARDATRAAGDRAGEGRASSLVATVSRRLGDYRGALGHYASALAIHRDAGDRPNEGETLHGLGLCHWRLGRYDDALALITEALAIYRDCGDRANEGRALHGLGLVHLQLGRYDEARALNERAIAVYREVGDRTSEGRTLNNLGIIDQRQMRYGPARSHYEAALRIAQEVGNRTGEGVALANLGDLSERLGRYDEAHAHCEQSLVLCRRIGYRVGQAEALRGMGLALLRLGRTREALEHLRNAIGLCRDLGETDTEIRALLDLAEALYAIGNPDQAREQQRAALDLADRTGDWYGRTRASAALATPPA